MGLFAGLSLGYFTIFSDYSTYNPSSFVWSFNAGGSLTMRKKHRIDLTIGSGFSTFAVRYLFMF